MKCSFCNALVSVAIQDMKTRTEAIKDTLQFLLQEGVHAEQTSELQQVNDTAHLLLEKYHTYVPKLGPLGSQEDDKRYSPAVCKCQHFSFMPQINWGSIA